jgi:phage shock protein A
MNNLSDTVHQLERRIIELEERIRELEEKHEIADGQKATANA